MSLILRVLGVPAYARLRRKVFCRLGFHGPKTGPNGEPVNACCWGCGLVYNIAMWQDYIVTLKDGQEYSVSATNEYHAGSVVVYGNQRQQLDRKTGQPLGPVIVHRDNIKSIRLKC